MPRVKITGYLNIEDDEHDPTDKTGMTAEAYEKLAMDSEGTAPQISDLDDLTVERVR